MAKIIFSILLIINLILIAGTRYYATSQRQPLPDQIHPEKIQLVPIASNCLIWGNFFEEQIRYAEKILSEQYPNLDSDLEPAGSTTIYWLYIPPFPNKEIANREINKLRNLGIVSFRVKDDAKWENAISLGIFYQQKDALKQLKEFEKKGITFAAIEERNVPLQKIVIHHPSPALKDEMQTLADQFDGTKLIQDKCERL